MYGGSSLFSKNISVELKFRTECFSFTIIVKVSTSKKYKICRMLRIYLFFYHNCIRKHIVNIMYSLIYIYFFLTLTFNYELIL